MRVNQLHSSMLISPARTLTGKVELFEGSTLLSTFKHTDALSSFTVARTAGKKFFGFGIAQELEVKLVDKDREIEILKEQILKASFGVQEDYFYPYPSFYVKEITRNENNNQLTIKAGDLISVASERHSVSELDLVFPYTIRELAQACARLIGATGISTIDAGASFDTVLDKLNVDGTENIRYLLDDIAEATQTIYYNDGNYIVFKRLDVSGNADLLIGKANYFTLTGKTACTLNAVASASELGDNVINSLEIDGYTQYVRENSIWSLRNDVGTLVDNALAAVGGFTANPFNCKWRGNYLLEIGDKIELITKNDETLTAYVLNEQITYNGGLVSTLSWEFNADDAEDFHNPSTLGDALKQTSAKVDKANQKIELMVKDFDEQGLTISQIIVNQEGITQRVEQQSAEIVGLTERVSQTITQEQMEIAIESALEDIDSSEVTTKTGFTFNADGLTVSKSGSEMSTLITEDGLRVLRGGEVTLSANNEGVIAEDLHATTYLLIGENSRLENYNGGKRTGCFWIGEV